jgi:SSS family solute:Na+ symporter
LTGQENLVTRFWSPTWTVVDPLVVALPLSFLVAVVVTLLTPPLDKAHVDYCFGGTAPGKEK